MNEWNQEKNYYINDLDRARMLRQEAMLLEQKEKVKSRIEYLMGISEDEQYDRYLAQILKDLESGRATPAQAEREAQRSYGEYRKKMARLQSGGIPAAPARGANLSAVGGQAEKPAVVESVTQKNTIEFKIGMHVFSMIGAVFVLVGFVILGFHFLGGLGQGLCLYGAAILTVVLSEFVFGRRILKHAGAHGTAFTGVLTGIGIGGLYAANLVNYLVLCTINSITAMAVTLLIAVITIFISRKRDSALIRIFSLIGCYLCFFPAQGINTELNFLVIAGILFVVNVISIFFPNRKNQAVVDVIHILLNVFFTAMLMGIAWSEGINSVYLAVYVVTSFLFINILSLRKCLAGEADLFPACCIGNTVFLILLFLIGNFGVRAEEPAATELFLHLMAEALIAAVCLVIFLLWNKEDGRRWAQLYYGTGVVLLLGSFSDYPVEILLSGLLALAAVKIFSGYKENVALDGIVTAWTGILAFQLSGYWYCWILIGALVLSATRIKRMHIYHELIITAVTLLTGRVRFDFYIEGKFGLARGWLYLLSAAALLILFLLFNHLPWLKEKKQRPYNIVNVAVMAFYYLGVWFCRSYVFSSAMMVLGAIAILVVFRERYEMGIRRKYLVLAGFLTWFSLTGHYESPVIVSILLMVIALGCVGVGFKMNDKPERICGLAMAAFVCLKLVLYDFSEVEAIYRVLVFLVVGTIALIISFIYVRLEKNMSRQEMEEADIDGENTVSPDIIPEEREERE